GGGGRGRGGGAGGWEGEGGGGGGGVGEGGPWRFCSWRFEQNSALAREHSPENKDSLPEGQEVIFSQRPPQQFEYIIQYQSWPNLSGCVGLFVLEMYKV